MPSLTSRPKLMTNPRSLSHLVPLRLRDFAPLRSFKKDVTDVLDEPKNRSQFPDRDVAIIGQSACGQSLQPTILTWWRDTKLSQHFERGYPSNRRVGIAISHLNRDAKPRFVSFGGFYRYRIDAGRTRLCKDLTMKCLHQLGIKPTGAGDHLRVGDTRMEK